MENIEEYKVLARKYRPQKFSDLIGQNSLVSILSNSITNKRTAHSYVLTGVRGVGKTTTARIISMSLNCMNRKDNDPEPCGNCDSCISIKQDRNMDVIEMDAASKTGVDDVREIIDNVKYKPVNCLFKIFIIDEVHMLSKNAFNALLKTLEEPPEHIKFIFATTEVKKIPITILSRCQRFDLHRIDNEILSEHILKISKLENINIDKEAVALIVRASDGSVRDSLSLLDQAIANNNDIIKADHIVKMLGLADRGKIFDLLDYIFAGNAEESLKLYNNLYKSGADITMIFDEMLTAVHFITQIKIAPKLSENIYIPELEREKGLEISSKLSMASLGIFWQVLFKGYQELQNGFHLHQLGEIIILRLIYIHQGPSPDDLLNKNNESDEFEKTSPKLSDNPDNISNKKDTNINDNSTIVIKNNTSGISIKTFREFVDLFFSFREGVLHSYLYNDVKLISFKEGEVTLNSEAVNDNNFNRKVAKCISKWTGRIWQINSSSSKVGSSLQEDDIINQQKEIDKMKNNPEMKNIFKSFPGIIIQSINSIDDINNEEKEVNLNKQEREK